MALISVIVPVYNVESYVGECLESILNQTFQDYEVLCIDDVSTDNSMTVVEEYAKKSSKIKILHHSHNRGLSAARNTGLDNADGKYILFVDSDDLIKPETLMKLFTKAEENNLDIVYFDVERIYEKEMVWNTVALKQCQKENIVCNGKEMFCDFLENDTLKMEVWRQFYRRDFLEMNCLRFYENILHEDLLFSFLCAMKAKRVENVNEKYYLYRIHGNSITATMSIRRMQSLYIVLVEIFQYWNENCFSESENQAIAKYFKIVYNDYLKKKSYFNKNKIEKIEIGTYAERYVFELLNSSSIQLVMLTELQIEALKQKEKILIFGAGRASLDVIRTLENRGICFEGVAVSDLKANAESICGIKIQSIRDFLPLKKDVLVIIAATKKYSGEMEKQLRDMGFESVMHVNDIA